MDRRRKLLAGKPCDWRHRGHVVLQPCGRDGARVRRHSFGTAQCIALAGDRFTSGARRMVRFEALVYSQKKGGPI